MTNAEKFIEVMNKYFDAGLTKKICLLMMLRLDLVPLVGFFAKELVVLSFVAGVRIGGRRNGSLNITGKKLKAIILPPAVTRYIVAPYVKQKSLGIFTGSNTPIIFRINALLVERNCYIRGKRERKMIESGELKPCPFCGGKAELQGADYFFPSYHVVCTNIHCGAFGAILDDKNSCVSRWNRRYKEI